MTVEGRRVGIIGAGAAGLMAAGAAARFGAQVLVLEKNGIPGRKLAITGKGRCNITNIGDRDNFLKNLPGNGRFLFSCLSAFTPKDTRDLFDSLGVALKVERGGRVFPESDDANEVVGALVRYAEGNGAKIRYGTHIVGIEAISSGLTDDVTGLRLLLGGGGRLEFDAVIIATGGASYPGTGSNGEGYKLAASLGHTIIDPTPALVPLESSTDWLPQLQGLALKNVEASLIMNGKVQRKEFGEMLFTHFGVSGPIVLTLSRHVTDLLRKGEFAGEQLTMRIDLKPALSTEELDDRIKRDLAANSRKQFRNCLDALLPKRLIPVITALSGVDPDKPGNQVTRDERINLGLLLKGLEVKITGTRPLNEAIITSGGISVKEISPKTMESKLVPGLYFAGEVIDIDGYTGGYNLQAAWSTAYAAGRSSAIGQV